MAERKTSSVEDEEGNLEASVKKMVASHNRKKKKSGGFQVMGMNVFVVNKKNEERICTFYATVNSAVVSLLNVPCYPSLSLTLVTGFFPPHPIFRAPPTYSLSPPYSCTPTLSCCIVFLNSSFLVVLFCILFHCMAHPFYPPSPPVVTSYVCYAPPMHPLLFSRTLLRCT